jgi:N-acetylglucosaminyldiphosphoundecaprenol N-acetyl-beta-D-mannosaminyltransferase
VTERFARSEAAVQRAYVLGCGLDRVDMDEALRRCRSFLANRSRTHQHMAVNAAKVVATQRDAELRGHVNACDLVTADGQAVVWAARLLGDPVPARVTGIDLMQELIALGEREGYSVFILGARPRVLATAIPRLRARHPRLTIAGSHHGFFSEADEAGIAARIRAARPDMLFVALPTPHKERFLARWSSRLAVPFAMGVGGAIDVLADEARRAPAVLQRLGLEWAFRLAQEPRRLWRRYLFTNCTFARLVVREIATGRRIRTPVPARSPTASERAIERVTR